MEAGQQLSFEDPIMAMLAARNTPYNSTAHALAELVDNSIDARARMVDLLLLNRRERTTSGQSVSVVREMAVFDDGHGMSPDVLQMSLRRGGRPDGFHSRPGRIGKYGVGLPTASLSQCKRVDVWSWEDGVDSAWHAYLDVDAVLSHETTGLAYPDRDPVVGVWLDHCRDELKASPTGTLVVWSQMDQVDWRTSRTTMDKVEEEVGRIYRYFLQRNEVSIVMQSFNVDEGTELAPRVVRPNDPMYLMTGTPPPHWPGGEPMFEAWGVGKTYRYTRDGTDHTVDVAYSLVKPEVLTDQGMNVAGNTPHGLAARRNVGISVVREGRELMTLPSLSNIGDPRHRWYGCELKFGSGCDDLFGVDHSKQLAARLQAVHKLVQRSSGRETHIDDEEYQARIEGDDRVLLLYSIVKDMKQDTSQMFNEIRNMRKSPPSVPVGPDVPLAETPDISDGATEMATRNVDDAVAQGEIDPTPTEQERRELTADDIAAALSVALAEDGLDPTLASQVARWAGNNGVGFVIVPGRVSGESLFDVRNDRGTVRVVLNQEHRLFRVLNVLIDEDQRSNLEDGELTGQEMAHLFYLLLCAWARMFEHAAGPQARRQMEQLVSNWGSEANYMLSSLAQQLLGDGG